MYWKFAVSQTGRDAHLCRTPKTGDSPSPALRWTIFATAMWLAAVGVGTWLVWQYAGTPGLGASGAENWPQGTNIQQAPREDTLVMFCHPHCPCSRASIAELARIVAQSKQPPAIWVVFYKPGFAGTDWTQTDLWSSAAEIPGAHLMVDSDGREARRFHATTSGQTFLYSPAGTLLFAGGVTSSRGHEGDNPGRGAIVDLINAGDSMCRSTPVYGCPIAETTQPK